VPGSFHSERPSTRNCIVTKNSRIITSAVSALLLSTAIAGCDILGLSGPSGPGELVANLLSPYPAEGAAVLEVSGVVGLGPVTADNGEVFYEADGSITRVVVILDDPGQIALHIRTQDVADLPTVTVVQVASGNNELRSSLDGYDVEWVQLADSDLNLRRGIQ